jgi:peptidylprolyl isomerase
MSTRTRPALTLLLLLAALAALAVSGCGGTDSSTADQFAEKAAEQVKNPPKLEEPKVVLKKVKVEPSEAEADLSKKPPVKARGDNPPDEVIAEDLVVGKGKTAETGDTVDVRYVGVLYKDGKEFDSSWARADNNFSFTLGGGQVIQGWDEGVAGMREGGRRRLLIPADKGYGAQGSPPKIPADAALLFVVDLKKVTKPKS